MKNVIHVSLALVAWFAVLMQYYLMIENRVAPIAETTVRFLSFFTILTNTLVAFYFTAASFYTKGRFSDFLNKGTTLTAVTIYIVVVGLVYQILLRHIWQPKGMQMIVDELLHTVIPILVLIYWIFDKRKSDMSYAAIPVWLIYPLFYLICILFRGYISGFYPYPFINVNVLGYNQVLLNSLGLFVTFSIMSLVFVAIAKFIDRQFL